MTFGEPKRTMHTVASIIIEELWRNGAVFMDNLHIDDKHA
jgi:hypothetical protein